MGYGSNLKKHLEEKGLNVSRIAKLTGIPVQTIYTSIKRDSSMRYDYALRISRLSGIPVEEICAYIPDWKEEETDEETCKLKAFLDRIILAAYYITREDEEVQEQAVRLFESFYALADRGRELLIGQADATRAIYYDAKRESHLMRFTSEEKE